MKTSSFLVMCVLLFPVSLEANNNDGLCGISPELNYLDPYTLTSKKHLWKDIPARGKKNTINVVVEIPAGRTEKWEVRKSDGSLAWDFKKGKPRVLKYLGYPGNYGMVPQTILSREMGGDGDPLDVIALGPPANRGEVLEVKLIGILKLSDDGEIDDKLIAVQTNSPLRKVDSLDQLREKFPGISQILEIWFVNYKGPGKMTSNGFGSLKEAEDLLNKASMHFSKIKQAE